MTTDQALQRAAAIARDELEALGVPTEHASALSELMDMGEHVIDLVALEYRKRAANPKPWAAFHRAMQRSLPRWRLPARWHHRRMARRYEAMARAGTHLPCAPD